MDYRSSIESLILRDRRISYAITDENLAVQQVCGPAFPGVEPSAVLGSTLLALVPELIGSEQALAALLTGHLTRFEIPMVNSEAAERADGMCYQNLVELPHCASDGSIIGVVHVVEDVTEAGRVGQQMMQHRNELHLLQTALREQNVQLLATNAELRRLDETTSAFVSIAAHELRTPLASISGYLEMLLDGDAGEMNPRQIEYLRIMEQSAGRLLHITRDLLDMTRIETGQLELVLQPTDLLTVVNSVIAEQMPQLEMKAQRLRLHAANPLPLTLCDPFRAAQIVGNLLNNASKYSSRESEIAVEINLSSDDADYVQLVVADQGVGIAEDDQARLFRPFFRASSAASTGASGTGLGLFIARSLTELHGGTISFDSTPGQGCTFRVTLPTTSGISLSGRQMPTASTLSLRWPH